MTRSFVLDTVTPFHTNLDQCPAGIGVRNGVTGRVADGELPATPAPKSPRKSTQRFKPWANDSAVARRQGRIARGDGAIVLLLRRTGTGRTHKCDSVLALLLAPDLTDFFSRSRGGTVSLRHQFKFAFARNLHTPSLPESTTKEDK
jgi:hypothetical protein